jgi:hypothetical protein
MKLEKIFAFHFLAMCVVLGLNALFQEQAVAVAEQVIQSFSNRTFDLTLVLRIHLYIVANIVLIVLAPVICRHGIHGVDGARVREHCSWTGLIGADLLFGFTWIALIFAPFPPPAWMNQFVFYFLMTVTCAAGMQVLVQINAYKINLTK